MAPPSPTAPGSEPVEASDHRPDAGGAEGGGRAVRDSGIAPAGSFRDSDADGLDVVARRAENALADCARLEANLGSLLRGLAHLESGARAARAAVRTLSGELSAALESLQRSRDDNLQLRDRARSLQDQLARSRQEAAAERERFIRQEDAFLAELLDDHEREIERLKRSPEAAEEAAIPLQPTRRLDYRATLPPPAGAPPSARTDSGSAIGAVKLRTIRIPRPRSTKPPDSHAAFELSQQATPSELPATETKGSEGGPASDKPTSAFRSRTSGYSLKAAEVREERVDGLGGPKKLI